MAVQTRMTKQRRIIIEELRKERTHPTADDLHARVRMQLPHISLGTVYRNLDFLAETGVILKLDMAGSIRRFDSVTEPHAHIRCIRCGRIGDMPLPSLNPDSNTVQADGFTVLSVHVEYEGLCTECAAKEKQ